MSGIEPIFKLGPRTSVAWCAAGCLLATLAVACQSQRPKQEAQDVTLQKGASTEMPQVREVPTSIREEDLPDQDFLALAVSETGYVAFVRSLADEPMITVLGSSGEKISSFGRRGEGPGEMLTPLRLAFDRDGIIVLTRPGVLARFTLQGQFLGEQRLAFSASGLPLAISADYVDEVVRESGSDGSPEYRIRRISVGEPGAVNLVESDEELLEGWFGRERTGQSLVLPYGSTDSEILFGDGMSYTIEHRTLGGSRLSRINRVLPGRVRGPRELAHRLEALERSSGVRGPGGGRMSQATLREAREAAATEQMPFFERAALFMDNEKRVWVFGTDEDGTFADVFAGADFLGRMNFPCLNRFGWRALTSRWIAMACESSNGDVPRLRRFTIEG